MRKGIVILIAAVLAAAAGAALLSLSAPLLDEDREYTLTALYWRGQEISDQVDEDEMMDLLRDASRSLIPRGALPQHIFAEMEHFFTVYKELENAKATSITDVEGRTVAEQVIAACLEQYKKDFGGKKGRKSEK